MFGQCRKIKKIEEAKEHNNHALSCHRQEIFAIDILIYLITKLRICLGIFICKTILFYGIDVNAGLAPSMQINFFSVFLHTNIMSSFYHLNGTTIINSIFMPIFWIEL